MHIYIIFVMQWFYLLGFSSLVYGDVDEDTSQL